MHQVIFISLSKITTAISASIILMHLDYLVLYKWNLGCGGNLEAIGLLCVIKEFELIMDLDYIRNFDYIKTRRYIDNENSPTDHRIRDPFSRQTDCSLKTLADVVEPLMEQHS
jgi:hypothetical protein